MHFHDLSPLLSNILSQSEYLRIHDLATTAERPQRVFTNSDGLSRIIRAKPAKAGLLPMGESTIWQKVKSGQFPQPVKLSERITAWKTADIIEWMDAKEKGSLTSKWVNQ